MRTRHYEVLLLFVLTVISLSAPLLLRINFPQMPENDMRSMVVTGFVIAAACFWGAIEVAVGARVERLSWLPENEVYKVLWVVTHDEKIILYLEDRKGKTFYSIARASVGGLQPLVGTSIKIRGSKRGNRFWESYPTSIILGTS